VLKCRNSLEYVQGIVPYFVILYQGFCPLESVGYSRFAGVCKRGELTGYGEYAVRSGLSHAPGNHRFVVVLLTHAIDGFYFLLQHMDDEL